MGAWTGTDQEAEKIFRTIYDDEYEKLVRCAASYLRVISNKPYVLNKAEDVVQETFALAWKHRTIVLAKESPVGWMYKALQYKAREMMREENKWTKRLIRYSQYHAAPVEVYVSLELELDGLVPKADFDLLHRFYIEGYSYRELCKETGLTKEALGVRMHRTRKKMREALEQ